MATLGVQHKIHPLVSEYSTLIDNEARKYSSFIPQHIVDAEAYRIAHEAAHSFDKKANVKFSTHLVNQLKQLARLSTTYGNIVRVPEHTQYALNTINKFQTDFEGEHGRQPTTEEISDGVGIPVVRLNKLLQGKVVSHTLSSLAYDPVVLDDKTAVDDWVHFVYHDLTPNDKLVFEHYTGFGGKKVLSENDIAKKMNIPLATVKSRIKFISKEIGKIKA